MRRTGTDPGWPILPWAMVVGAVLAPMLPGCVPPSRVPGGDRAAVEVEFDREAMWSQVRAAQQARLEALAVFSSAGTATIRFTDADGDARTEQVDLRVWRVAPDRAAVRLSKVGASFLLAGWNGDRWWVLDESRDETVLSVRGLDGVRPGRGVEALLAPPVLLAMIGLLPWPGEMPTAFEATRLNDEGRVISVRFELPRIAWPTPGGPPRSIPGRMQVEIDDLAAGPRRIRLMDASGEVVVESELDRLESVETRGRPPGDWPVLPHRVRVVRGNGDEISVSLDAPLAGGEVSARLFDLDVLRSRHPEAIVEEVGVTTPAPGGDS